MGSKMDALMSEVNKKVKEEIISQGLASFNYRKIPFTSPRMNYCTYGGIPIGKITEFFGAEHGGKTTSALDIVANFQALERQKSVNDSKYIEKDVFYCDCENTLDSDWAQKLGVDTDRMYLLQPKAQSAEEIFNLITEAIETGDIGLVVIDSIAAMVSEDEFEKGYDEKSFGGISGPLSRFAKKMAMLTAKYNCTLIGINQVRDDVNSSWGGYKTPGGRAWKHNCIARFEFRKGKYIDEKGNELSNSADTPAGNLVMLAMVKNKTCPPNRRTGFYTLNYAIGIDYLADLIEVALKYEIIEKSGAWFTVPGVPDKIQGQAGVRKYLEEHQDILKQVEDLIDAKIQ
jgi:recombination protein RecA